MKKIMKTIVLSLLRQTTRHVVATSFLAFFLAALMGAFYFTLLFIAIITNQGYGGPLTLPLLIIGSIALGLLAGAILCPLTLATEMLCNRLNRFKVIGQIPISTMLLLVTIALPCIYLSHSSGGTTLPALVVSLFLAPIPMIVLGIYWWTLQAIDGGFWVVRRMAELSIGLASGRIWLGAG